MECGSEEEGVVCTAVDGIEGVGVHDSEDWGLGPHRG
jgi:hypothetical protein